MTSMERSYRNMCNEFLGLINWVTETRSQDSGYGQLEHMLVLLACAKKQVVQGNVGLPPLYEIMPMLKLTFCLLMTSQLQLVIDLACHRISLCDLSHSAAEC